MDEFHLPPDLFFEVRDIADLKWRRFLKQLTDALSSRRWMRTGLNLQPRHTSGHGDRRDDKE
jgi:hypothetical protein